MMIPTLWAAAVLPIAFAQSQDMRWAFREGETLTVTIRNLYEMAVTPDGPSVQSYDHHFVLDFKVLAEEGGMQQLSGTVRSASFQMNADLLKAWHPNNQNHPEFEKAGTPLQRGLGQGIHVKLDRSLRQSSTDSLFGMFLDNDPMSLPWIYAACFVTEMPTGPLTQGREFGVVRESTADISKEMTNRVTALDGGVATIETTIRSRAVNLSDYMDRLLELLPVAGIDFKLNATTVFDLARGRGRSLLLQATYPVVIDGAARRIVGYTRQTIEVKLE